MPAADGLAVGISVPGVIVGSMFAFAYRRSLKRAWRRVWRRLRVRTLGGVTTLDRKLSYNCAICMDSMDVREVVRTLSCDHVFHCGKSDKCKDHIDKWLRDKPTMSCPVCRKTARLVLPWKAPPPSAPAPAPAPVPPAAPAPAPVPAPSANQEQPESSSGMEDTTPSDLEDPPLQRSSPVLEEQLLQPSQ